MNRTYQIFLILTFFTNIFPIPNFETFEINKNKIFLINSENLSRYQFIQLIEYFSDKEIKIDKVLIDENKEFVERYASTQNKYLQFEIFPGTKNYKYAQLLSPISYDFVWKKPNSITDDNGNTSLHNILLNCDKTDLKKQIIKPIIQEADFFIKNNKKLSSFDLIIQNQTDLLKYLIKLGYEFETLKQIHLDFLKNTTIESLLDFNLFLAQHACNSQIPLITFISNSEDLSFPDLFAQIKNEIQGLENRAEKIHDEKIKEQIQTHALFVEDFINDHLQNQFYLSPDGILQKSIYNFVMITKNWFLNSKMSEEVFIDSQILLGDFPDYVEGSEGHLFNLGSESEEQLNNFLKFLCKYQNLLEEEQKKSRDIFIEVGNVLSQIGKFICKIKTFLFLQENEEKNILIVLNNENYKFVRNNLIAHTL